MFRDFLTHISGTASYSGSAIDKVGLWTFFLVVATILLWWVAKKQLGGISKTAKVDFIKKFSNEFFSETTRDVLMLLDYNALNFRIKEIEYGENIPSKPFPYFLINEEVTKQLEIEPEKLKRLLDRKTYSAFEIDDCLLGYFEDMGSFEKYGLLDIDHVYDYFDWYIENCWNNGEIKKYIEQQRGEEKDGDDIYENFEYIFNKCCSFEKSKNKNEPKFWWRLKWWLFKK